MIKHEDEYLDYIKSQGVGAKDIVADSAKSYRGYLNAVSGLLEIDISPETIHSKQDVEELAELLLEHRKRNTVRNYCSALNRYVEMVQKENLWRPSLTSEIHDAWIAYNQSTNRIATLLGRTANIVGEYAEYLFAQHFQARLLIASSISADIQDRQGLLYQVKARKIPASGRPTTSLGIIRSWDFDVLCVVLFNTDGSIHRAITIPVDSARKYAKPNALQNGDVVTTSAQFLNDGDSADITDKLSKVMCA